MKREILFKAKRIVNEKWVYGSFIKPIIIRTENGLDCTIDPETVCQYTGLKDREGTKIFEGDILKCLMGYITVTTEVKYLPGHFYLPSSPFEENACVNQVFFENNSEIIGNRFDNPELLKD